MDNNLFKNKKVLVMGLGLHGGGVGVAKFFCEQGADVLVTDLKTEEQLKESVDKLTGLTIKYSLGGHKEADFLWADLVIKNPDVPSTSPYLELARKNDIPIKTDIELFFEMSGAFIIGVTGTKGKSTTASLIYHFLKTKHDNVFLAGNIGISPLELLEKVKKGDFVVLELSSFELEDLSQSPNIAVITNIMPDHLNRYGTMEEYIDAKKRIFKFQKKNDILILNGDDLVLRPRLAGSTGRSASRQFEAEAASRVHFYSVKDKPKNIDISRFKLFGEHNLSNLLAAIEVAKILEVPAKNIEKSLADFKGVQSRLEFVGEYNGVKYFNDTTATIPEAVIAAINAFSEEFPDANLILICGGINKGLNFSELIKSIRKKVSNVIMLPGTASDKIREKLTDYKNIHEISSMQEAVKVASELAKDGDVVVLSPGGSSFNLFKNEFDRGKQFIKAVKSLNAA